jgi:hypothetical protein
MCNLHVIFASKITPRYFTLFTNGLNCVVSLTALRRTQVKTLLATINVAFVGYHGKSCLSGCYLDTDLRKRYLVIEVLNMWDVSTGGSHKSIPTAACRRSWCRLLRMEGCHVVSAADPHVRNLRFLGRLHIVIIAKICLCQELAISCHLGLYCGIFAHNKIVE